MEWRYQLCSFGVKIAKSKKPTLRVDFLYCGALNQNRTGDLILTMDALCLLSYEGIFSVLLERVKGIEPSQSAWEADVLPLNYTRMHISSCSKTYFSTWPYCCPVLFDNLI